MLVKSQLKKKNVPAKWEQMKHNKVPNSWNDIKTDPLVLAGPFTARKGIYSNSTT